jgi:hypothetical protein
MHDTDENCGGTESTSCDQEADNIPTHLPSTSLANLVQCIRHPTIHSHSAVHSNKQNNYLREPCPAGLLSGDVLSVVLQLTAALLPHQQPAHEALYAERREETLLLRVTFLPVTAKEDNDEKTTVLCISFKQIKVLRRCSIAMAFMTPTHPSRDKHAPMSRTQAINVLTCHATWTAASPPAPLSAWVPSPARRPRCRSPRQPLGSS